MLRDTCPAAIALPLASLFSSYTREWCFPKPADMLKQEQVLRPGSVRYGTAGERYRM
jgi:hypothetical protein